MRILADENFPKPIVEFLRTGGNDVLWALTDCSERKDVALLAVAENEGRVLLTLDKDFWQIAIQRRVPLQRSGVVLFRVHPATPESLEPLVRLFIQEDKEWAGHISTIARDGIQMLAVGRGR